MGENLSERDKRAFFRALFPPVDRNLHRDEQESQDHRYYQGSNRLSDWFELFFSPLQAKYLPFKLVRHVTFLSENRDGRVMVCERIIKI